MNPKRILRLLKALMFIIALIIYKLMFRWASALLFAIVLALYIIELYKGGKNE